MRVIAGRWGGIRLTFHAQKGVRPTTDRVKETLFNILSDRVEGAQVLDLFAGTGSWGIEALSRGAKFVVFVEKSQRMVENIRENLQSVRCTENFKIVIQDVHRFLKKCHCSEAPFDLIFADPPYSLKLGDTLVRALSQQDFLKRRGIFILKHGSGEEISDTESLKRTRIKKMGETQLSFFRFEKKG
ncbi:ribosomal RNA small subunit methyltransferase D [bacterium BMS3Abin05]|nr:ribosomal RNA small subunit methyltransferase D [bacterium BMS3Abin05]GBE28503.1 ribosomal RNA small subunit methyltransferase D [bacterium BMS3Bbin03]HDL78882.1 16S rRNA (guanine(966)-N(2))-methyltransferase RsmD [Bacteroidota bacterium]HDZ10805.1 16S rRNA (guanine(966)-N(2))-methyltransferase RsmD [Bacteroidota bacterium]